MKLESTWRRKSLYRAPNRRISSMRTIEPDSLRGKPPPLSARQQPSRSELQHDRAAILRSRNQVRQKPRARSATSKRVPYSIQIALPAPAGRRVQYCSRSPLPKTLLRRASQPGATVSILVSRLQRTDRAGTSFERYLNSIKAIKGFPKTCSESK